MLLSKEAIRLVESELQALFTEFYRNTQPGGISSFEDIYLVGKVVSRMGDPSFLKLPFTDLRRKADELGIVLTVEDRAVLKMSRNHTDLMVAGIQGQLEGQIRTLVAHHERDWAEQLLRRGSEGQLRKTKGAWRSLRKAAVKLLMAGLSRILKSFESTVDRFLQTEIASYFQHGQVSEVSSDELIYKIPRPQACPHCMRLHLNPDGSPKIYRLRDVVGNTNLDRKSGEWRFVVGPTHPHCYCILYRVEKRPPGGPNDLLASARKESLGVGLQRRREILAAAKAKLEEAEEQAK